MSEKSFEERTRIATQKFYEEGVTDTHINAIDQQIKKWIDICYNDGEDNKYLNSKLCELYGDDGTCHGYPFCPVYIDTGQPQCKQKEKWNLHQLKKHPENHEGMVAHWKVDCPKCEKLAKQILYYYKGLKKRMLKKQKEHSQTVGKDENGSD